MQEKISLKWKKKFFTIMSGQTVSLIGSSAVQFALIWWLASETESPMMMAFSGLMAFLPQLILGPFAGVWIDRLKRKNVVICADLFMGTAALIFAGCFLIGQPPYWSACIVLLIRGIGNVFHTPAMQSIVPLLVPSDKLVKANGWSQFLQSGAFMLGPVLGAAMYAALPIPVILLTDFIGAMAASGTMAIVKIPELKKDPTQSPHFFQEMKLGVSVFLQDKKLLTVAMAAFGCMLFFMPLSSYYPLMTSSYFEKSAWHASLVEMLYAAGMMGSSLFMGLFGTIQRKFLVVHIGLLGIGVTSLLCGLIPATNTGFWLFAIVCTFMGASGNIYGIPYMAYMQETIPPEALGRAFSVFGSLMSVTMPLGLLLSGPFAEKFGVVFWFFITGIATLVITLISGVVVGRINHTSKM